MPAATTCPRCKSRVCEAHAGEPRCAVCEVELADDLELAQATVDMRKPARSQTWFAGRDTLLDGMVYAIESALARRRARRIFARRTWAEIRAQRTTKRNQT